MTRTYASRGLWSRGYLPHSRGGGSTQFVTFRLSDTLPNQTKESWRSQLRSAHSAFDAMDDLLDQGFGNCWLARDDCARIVVERIRGWLAEQACVHSWVVMPNHVHLLATLPEDSRLGPLVKGLKGATALQINKTLGRSGRLWQREYFDREVCGEKEIDRVREYIEYNPVKAGLCKNVEDWKYSSACYRGG